MASTSSFFACSAWISPRMTVSSVRRSRSGVSCSSSDMALSCTLRSFCRLRRFLRSSSLTFWRLFFGFSCRSIASISRCTRCTDSTWSLISSIKRRLTISVNSMSRIRRERSTRHRSIFHRYLRYLRLSFFGISTSFSSAFCTDTRALRTASTCRSTSFFRSSSLSSVNSSSEKVTSSRTVRSSALRSSPSWMTFRVTIGVREIDLMTESLPRSILRAISTSPSRVSRGTVPISRRYIRTGSLVLSSAPGVRSSSISSLPSAVRSKVFSSRNFI